MNLAELINKAKEARLIHEDNGDMPDTVEESFDDGFIAGVQYAKHLIADIL